MKFIEKSRIETFLKAKGYNQINGEIPLEEAKYSDHWYKTENDKVMVPKKDIIGSNELSKIFLNESLLNEFRKY